MQSPILLDVSPFPLPFEPPYIFSAWNLTLLSAYANGEIDVLNGPYVFWADGVGVRLTHRGVQRHPGRAWLRLLISNWARLRERITLVGSFDPSVTRYMDRCGLDYAVVSAPYGAPHEIFDQISNEIATESVVLCIPSAKQEKLAALLVSRMDLKVYCFGGALNMLAGAERAAPEPVSRMGLEWLWRLHSDTRRRFARLLAIAANGRKIYLGLAHARTIAVWSDR